jgi:tRNA(fMet)-specific endonuclease VapC
MALFLLDTNIVIAAMKGVPQVRRHLEAMPINLLRLSAIVLGELEFGAEKSAHSVRNRARLIELTRSLPLVGVDADTTLHYARIRAALERQGTPIGANDLWIAAQALAINAALVTDNQREFQRVPGLSLANWITD